MERLKRLDLSNNQISGPIPKELGNLLEMEHLDMSVNELTGSLPGEMGRLIGLKVVYLNYNDLSGSVPPEWIGMGEHREVRCNHHSDIATRLPPEGEGWTWTSGLRGSMTW